MDFDPRDYDDARDPRDTHDWDERDRGHDSRDRDDDRHATRDRADHRNRDDARWPERDRDPRDRATDPREVFTRGLNLCPAAVTVKSSTMLVIANTHSGDLRAARSRPSEPFASCRPATSETVTTDQRIHVTATSDIYANRV